VKQLSAILNADSARRSTDIPAQIFISHETARQIKAPGDEAGVITEAEYFRILAGILSHPVDLKIDKMLSSLKICDSLPGCKVNSTKFNTKVEVIKEIKAIRICITNRILMDIKGDYYGWLCACSALFSKPPTYIYTVKVTDSDHICCLYILCYVFPVIN
jgi:hypothetical protein